MFRKRKKKNYKIALLIVSAILLIFIISALYNIYKEIYGNNTNVFQKEYEYIYIKSNSDFNDVVSQLVEKKIIKDRESFEWVAEMKKYKKHIHPGRYKITNEMNNNELVNLLRSGKQTPVELVFQCVRTKADFAEIISNQIEADKTELLSLLNNGDYMKKYGLNNENALVLFIPNTYQIYWNTTAEKFIERMAKEYNRFWNNDKKKKAGEAGLTPPQVSVLASIVEQETNMNTEKPIIAGVYINRLRNNKELEADPTLKFALNDFTIKRILNKHKDIVSPYNTYMHKGLPPGPICIPSASSISSVLNYAKHGYIYFCAREDFSGYHNFAKTPEQHLINAGKYQRKLDELNIRN
ncbi:MAG: endolytic transglycosylase MltG [Bacteroidales bacterium]|nr:endolytic transglycosylase MltG [Bacteroidales bacterium]